MKYYVYELVDPRTNNPFYVGKGSGNRAELHTKKVKAGKDTENPYKDRVIRQIILDGLEPIVKYVFWSDNENIAYEQEELLIKFYGRREYEPNGLLTNLCEASRPPHDTYTEQRKQVYRERMVGNTLRRGIVQTDEEKLARSIGLTKAWKTGKRVVTNRMREASRTTHTGKVVSEKTKEKMATHRKGKTLIEMFGEEKARLIKEKARQSKAGKSRIGITVYIDGVRYISVAEAARVLKITEYKVKKLYVSKQV